MALLLELDDEVRNGGFAQYFFNPSASNAIDAWFASKNRETLAHQLLRAAFARIEVELGVPLALNERTRRGGEAHQKMQKRLCEVLERAHGVSPDPPTAFAQFRGRLAGSSGSREGFDSLSRRFFSEVDVSRALARWVAAEPDAFLARSFGGSPLPSGDGAPTRVVRTGVSHAPEEAMDRGEALRELQANPGPERKESISVPDLVATDGDFEIER